MASIWVIEKGHESELVAAEVLMGDFPVRKIASLQSFARLIRIRHSQRPDALIVDARAGDFSLEYAEEIISEFLPACPRIYLIPEVSNCPIPSPRPQVRLPFYIMTKNIDNLSFSKYVRHVLSQTQNYEAKNPNFIVYRDLKLDINLFNLQIFPQKETATLPLKEARLLRLFMENIGICLSRDEIKRAVWDGVKIESRTIDSHISRLRKRIASGEVTIESLYGDGYLMA